MTIDFKDVVWNSLNGVYEYHDGPIKKELKVEDFKFVYNNEQVFITNIDMDEVKSKIDQTGDIYLTIFNNSIPVNDTKDQDVKVLDVDYKQIHKDENGKYYFTVKGKERDGELIHYPLRFENGQAYNINNPVKILECPFNAPKEFANYRADRPEASIKIMGIDRYKAKHGFGATVKEIQRVCDEQIKKLRDSEIKDISMDSLTVEQIAYLKGLAKKG